jgi:hypothetical protein
MRDRRFKLLIILAVAGVLGGGAIVWHKVVRDYVIPKNFGVVEPGSLYRAGGLTESAMRRVVRDHHIRTIIDLGAFDHQPEREQAMHTLASELDVDRHVFRLKGDGTGNPNDYVAALRLMNDPANQPTLVMCSAGAQRTGAAVILYRHILQGRAIEDCYAESFDYRHDPGKDWIMLAYLADWADDIEQAWSSGGWVDGQPPAKELYTAALDGSAVAEAPHDKSGVEPTNNSP